MEILKPAVLTAAWLSGALLCGGAAGEGAEGGVAPSPPAASPNAGAAALDAESYARLPVCTLSADGQRLAVEPCRTAPAQVPMPRRPVYQIIQRMPTARLAPQAAMPASPSLAATPRRPAAPTALSGCDLGGCYDTRPTRQRSAPPGTTSAPAAKPCGAGLQC